MVTKEGNPVRRVSRGDVGWVDDAFKSGKDKGLLMVMGGKSKV